MEAERPDPTRRCPGCFAPQTSDGPCPSCGFGPAPVPDQVMPIPEAGELHEPTAPAPSPSTRDDPFGPALPPEPTGGFQTQPTQEPPPLPSPVILIWFLLIALIAAYVHQGAGVMGQLPISGFEHAGGLSPDLLDQPARHAWRLLFGSFVHNQFFTVLVSAFLVFFLGLEVERSGGGGLLLTVFLGVGAAQNGLRCVLEPAASLKLLAGAWPGGFALGGAALVLALRQGRPVARVVSLFVFEALLLSFFAYTQELLHWRLAAVVGAGALAAAVLAALWPLERGRGACGCLAILGLLLMTLAATGVRQEQLQREENPPPWEQRKPRRIDLKLTRTSLDPLGVSLEMPNWKEHPRPRPAICAVCNGKVVFPKKSLAELRALKDETATCPTCKATDVRPSTMKFVLFSQRSLGTPVRALQVWTWPKGQYDAPDTLLGDRQIGGQRALLSRTLLSEGHFPAEGKTALGLGYRIVIQGLQPRNSKPSLLLLYMFVGKRRSVLVRFEGLDPQNPFDREAEIDLFDRIAETVAETRP